MAVLAADVVSSLSTQLAGLVLVTRARFTAIYNAVVKELRADPSGAFSDVEFFQSAVLGGGSPPANDVIAFQRALAAAEKGGWLKPLVSRCNESAALDQKAIALVWPEQAKTVLQGIVDRLAGFENPNGLADGLQRTMPKICLVRINEPGGVSAQGTGFLVGPQTVLTAWHVVEPLLDGTGQPRADSDQWLTVEFDFIDSLVGGGAQQNIKSFGVVPGWLEDNSPCYPDEKPSVDGITDAAALQAIAGEKLDFAVIRLKGSPGRDRGIVKLRNDPVELKKNNPPQLLVFQHPNRFPQRVAGGPMTSLFGTGNPPPRFRHNANTATGSSGGLCVNSQFECVGLHQAAIIDGNKNLIANQAVPASLIVPLLLAAHRVDVTLDPLMELSDTGEPVIGRTAFQEIVWKAVKAATPRAVLVHGVEGAGWNFSEKILRSLLSPRDTLVVKFRSDQIGSDAVVFATWLLGMSGGTLPPGESFLQKTASATANAAWLRDELARGFSERLATVAQGRQVWFVVDDLRKHSALEGDGLSFLQTLVAAEQEAPFVRFLLIGLSNLPLASRLYAVDAVDWPIAVDVEAYIRRYLTSRNKVVAADVLANYVNSVMTEARDAPDSRWAGALRFITRHIHPLGKGP